MSLSDAPSRKLNLQFRSNINGDVSPTRYTCLLNDVRFKAIVCFLSTVKVRFGQIFQAALVKGVSRKPRCYRKQLGPHYFEHGEYDLVIGSQKSYSD